MKTIFVFLLLISIAAEADVISEGTRYFTKQLSEIETQTEAFRVAVNTVLNSGVVKCSGPSGQDLQQLPLCLRTIARAEKQTLWASILNEQLIGTLTRLTGFNQSPKLQKIYQDLKNSESKLKEINSSLNRRLDFYSAYISSHEKRVLLEQHRNQENKYKLEIFCRQKQMMLEKQLNKIPFYLKFERLTANSATQLAKTIEHGQKIAASYCALGDLK